MWRKFFFPYVMKKGNLFKIKIRKIFSFLAATFFKVSVMERIVVVDVMTFDNHQ